MAGGGGGAEGRMWDAPGGRGGGRPLAGRRHPGLCDGALFLAKSSQSPPPGPASLPRMEEPLKSAVTPWKARRRGTAGEVNTGPADKQPKQP